MAMDVLRENGGLSGLLTATPHSLRRNGLGPAKAASLLAAVELGRRLAREQLLDREPLSRPVDVARYLALRYHTSDQEVMGALFLDARSLLLGEREMFRGTLSRISVEPREILRECLQRGRVVDLPLPHPSERRPVAERRGPPLHPAHGGGGRDRRPAPGGPRGAGAPGALGVPARKERVVA